MLLKIKKMTAEIKRAVEGLGNAIDVISQKTEQIKR